MIHARLWQSEDTLGFEISGHAGYAAHGEDIVCAAVSAVAQAVAMGLEMVAGASERAQIRDGFLSWSGENRHDVLVLWRTLRLALLDIAQTHPTYLVVEENVT